MPDQIEKKPSGLDYHALFEKMLNGFAYHKVLRDSQGNPSDYVFLEINTAFEKMIGHTRDEIIGRTVTEVLPEIARDKNNWIEKYGRIANGGGEKKFTAYSETLDKWFHIYAFSAEKDFFATIIEDVTEEKQEYSLNLVYKKLLDRTADMITILDIGLNPKYIFANQAHKEILGYEPEYLIGKSPVEFVHKDDWSKMMALIKKNIMRAGKQFLQRKEYIKPEKIRYRFKTKSGKYVTIESTADMIDNKIFVVSRDVTEQINYLKTLKNEKQRAETYFNIAGNVLMALDENGTVVKLNQSGASLLDAEPEEVTGKNWFTNFVPEEARVEVQDVFQKLLKGDMSVKFYESAIISKKGLKKHVWWHNTVLRDDNNKIIGTLSSGEDVTEKHKAEQKIKKRNTELERFNKLTVGREVKMVQLKEEVERLKQELQEAKQQ